MGASRAASGLRYRPVRVYRLVPFFQVKRRRVGTQFNLTYWGARKVFLLKGVLDLQPQLFGISATTA